MNIKQIIKYAKVIQDNKTMCKCGHSVFIPNHLEKIVCNWCGNYVFKDKKMNLNLE